MRIVSGVAAHDSGMHDPATREALSRIEMEYVEMPGLKLTVAQVHRLCNLPQDVCVSALDVLTREGFLCQMSNGAFLRQSSGGRRAQP